MILKLSGMETCFVFLLMLFFCSEFFIHFSATGIQGDLYRHRVLNRTGDVAAGSTDPGRAVTVPGRAVTEGEHSHICH